MDMQYLNYCLPGNPWYDVDLSEAQDLDFASAELPDGWSRRFDSNWCYQQPPVIDLPGQGWKVHVSATPNNAERVLKVVWDYCLETGMLFKFIRSHQVLLRRNSKYGDRGASGKFITIFPADEKALERTLSDLAPSLAGESGPYILSDLRIGAGPLYVRYGGFVARLAPSPTGEMVHVIESPDGTLVPDQRRPGFHPPEWVTIPDCLAESVAARSTGTLKDFPYRATKALHFSNGGGVYRATNTQTGEEVLLKEARPFAGLDEDGQDAVLRLEREQWAMEQLAGLPCVPRLMDFRVGHEHRFLAREFVDGKALVDLIHTNNPVVNPDSTFSVAEYTTWALDVYTRVGRCLSDMHAAGVVFGDVHPNNVLVRPDGELTFIDFETATSVDDNLPQRIGAPGFRSPADYRGPAVDLYGLGCLGICLFLPLTVTLPWGPAMLDQLLAAVSDQFPVPADYAARVRRDLGVDAPAAAEHPWPALISQPWPEIASSLGAQILASASVDRTDRLYPGDISQFTTPGGGLTLASGASGVIWALNRLGLPVPAEHYEWLSTKITSAPSLRPGFYDGLAGLSFAYNEWAQNPSTANTLVPAGFADELIARAVADPEVDPRRGLHSGAAGIGLAALQLYRTTGEPQRLADAQKMAGLIGVAEAVGLRMGPPGLLWGNTGNALLYVQLGRVTGESGWLDRATAAVTKDLELLGWKAGEGSTVTPAPPSGATPGWHTPALGWGGAGIALVLKEILSARPDAELQQVLDILTARTAAPFIVNSGLFNGRAGAMLTAKYLADGSSDESAGVDSVLENHVRALGLNAVPTEASPVFLGDHGFRLSNDLGTGTAGILLALNAALGDGEVHLPFFDRQPS